MSSSSIARVRTVIVGGPRRGLGVRGSFFGVQERGGAASSSLVPRLGSEILAGGGAEEFEFEFEFEGSS